MKGECLGAIYKNSRDANIPSYMITSWDCKTKTSIVCEKEPAKFHATKIETPNFPCIPNNKESKKKRQDYASALELNLNSDSFGGQRNLAKRNSDGTSEEGIFIFSFSKFEAFLICFTLCI